MRDDDPPSAPSKPTRRTFLLASAGVAEGPNIEGPVPITLRINGKDHQLRVDPGRRCWIVFVRRLLSPERRRAVTTANAAHVQCM